MAYFMGLFSPEMYEAFCEIAPRYLAIPSTPQEPGLEDQNRRYSEAHAVIRIPSL
jgi:hypothetical protein